MKTRLFTILPVLLILFSFNASATISLACGIVGSIETGDLVDQPATGIIDLRANENVRFMWTDTDSNASTTEVLFTYYTLDDITHKIGYETHNSSGTNMIDWIVPSELRGQTILITVSDIDDSNNFHTIKCTVANGKVETSSFNDFEINCYPNPVVNSLNIQSGNQEAINSVSLYDLKGNNVGAYEFNQSYNESIDVSGLPTGSYVAIINNEKQFKIVKR